MGSGVKLDEDDHRRIADLWNDIINPACVEWGRETGKPAEAYREAVVGAFERQLTKFNPWNAWQRVWWHGLPDIEDDGLACTLVYCPFHDILIYCSGAP